MVSSGRGSTSQMRSGVTLERFVNNVGVLKALTRNQQDDVFKKEVASLTIESNPFDYFAALVSLLERGNFFKHPRKESVL